jgi:hypothetical protein
MRHALERIDVSENVARRKRFEFVTLAGVACWLIGFGAFAGAAFVQGGYYKGILYIGAGLVVFGFSLYLRTRGFTSAVSYTDRLQSGEGADRVAILQLSSEVIVLSGAWALFANAALAVLTDGGIELLSLVGLIMLIVGVNLSLRLEELARAKERELWERGLRTTVLLLPPSGDDALSVRGRFSLGRPGSSSYPDAGFTRVVRERLNDAGRVVTVSDSDYFVTTRFVRGHPLEFMKGVSGSERTLRPVGSDRDEPAGEVSRQKVKELMRKARLVVMIIGKIGKIAEPGGKFSASMEHILSTRGMLVFPPVSYRETQACWESFCQQIYGAAPLRLVSDHELKRAVLFVFRKRAGPLLITADTRDEWTYQAALDEAMAAVRRDESGTESGFAGLEGAGSTRSR